MPDILTLLTCLIFELENTSLKHLSCIIQGMLAMSGRVTMQGISRWTGKGAPMKLIKQAYLISYTIKRDNLLGSDKRRG